MLKIKDNVDLKELEKFGFKFRYNQDTGELEKLIKSTGKDKNDIYFCIEVNKYWEDICDFFNPIKENKQYRVLQIKYRMACSNDDCEYLKIIVDDIYDLIQAGLVEKQ